jgi:hypothetical protein
MKYLILAISIGGMMLVGMFIYPSEIEPVIQDDNELGIPTVGD